MRKYRTQYAGTESRRKQIILTALACFVEMGFVDTTMEDIRVRSKSSNGSIYHHFKSKDQLAAAVYLEGIIDYQEGMAAELEKMKAEIAIQREEFQQEMTMKWQEFQQEMQIKQESAQMDAQVKLATHAQDAELKAATHAQDMVRSEQDAEHERAEAAKEKKAEGE